MARTEYWQVGRNTENGETEREHRGAAKFTLESHINQTPEFNLGLSKDFCVKLLEEDPNDMSCHSTPTDSLNGAVLYPLYIRLASALYQYVKSGAVCRTYEKMVFSDKDSVLKQKEENWNQLIKEKGLELINVLVGISCEIHVQEPYFSLLKDGRKTIEGRCATGGYTRMENDKFTATASNMKNDDVEKASASNIDEEITFAEFKTWETWPDENLRSIWVELEGFMKSQDRADECCIYRVPHTLRVSNREAYTPQLISIGPFHHNSKRLKAMETLKGRYQGDFLNKNEMNEKKFRDFLGRILEEEQTIRLCYSESFRIDTVSFVKMIVLDAVFVIEFLKESCAPHHFPKNIDTRMRFCIGEDLMLLENQLPFYILDLIYSEFYHPSQNENETPLLDLATRHFGKYPLAQGPESIYTTDEVQHFTDLLMKSMLKGALKRENRPDPIKLKYNAAMLRKAGVKFQKTMHGECLFNVRFEKGVLEIPTLKVDDSLELVVRNVMAWEQCSKPDEAYISNYFRFMDHLINTAEDVDLLIEEGIIHNCLSDSESVSNLMNNLSQRSEPASYYSDICRDLNKHYETPWNRSKATLKLVYFSNLWRGTGTVAAAFLLILTQLQTITSLKSAF